MSAVLQSRKAAVSLLFFGYVVMSVMLYNRYGVKIMNDSPRYLDYADNLNDGFYYDPLNFWYFTYVILIYCIKVFSQDPLMIILTQYVLGFFAMLAVYRTTELLSGRREAAFWAGVFFMVFPDNLFWHSYVLTESIYCTILCFWLLLAVMYWRERTQQHLIALVLMTIICFFSKPTSPALIIAWLLPLVIGFLLKPSYRVLKVSGVVIGSVLVFLLANEMIDKHLVLLIYEKGDIIYAMHQFPTSPYHDLLTVAPPKDLYVPEQGERLLVSMFSFVMNNPWFYAKLIFGKLVVYLTHLRPYWSLGHNVWVTLVLFPAYFFSIVTIKKKVYSARLISSALFYVGLHTFIVVNTWVDWDARFFVPLFPLLALMAGTGLSLSMKKPNQ